MRTNQGMGGLKTEGLKEGPQSVLEAGGKDSETDHPQSSPGALNTTHCFPPEPLLQNRLSLQDIDSFPTYLTHIKQGSQNLLHHLWFLYYSLPVYIFFPQTRALALGRQPLRNLSLLSLSVHCTDNKWIFSIFCTEMAAMCSQNITCPW